MSEKPKTCAFCKNWTLTPLIHSIYQGAYTKTMWCIKGILDKHPEILEKGLPCKGWEPK